ncbi:MAG: bifunctional folylpolyglutamate synthase/dihydrofolate synthase [Campylobacterales bacterium]
MSLEYFLQTKPLESAPFDPDRIKRCWRETHHLFEPLPPIIRLVGTNGKGTTGRFIASMLRAQGYIVGHYTSPHLLSITERFWIDGADAKCEELEESHIWLKKHLGEWAKQLSYFEYLTLLALRLFRGCDWIVLEAGMGGEFDATAIVSAKLLVVTPIGLDHQAVLGETIEEIAATKVRGAGAPILLGEQPKSAEKIIRGVAAAEGNTLLRVTELLSSDAIAEVKAKAAAKNWPSFLEHNLLLAAAALRAVGIDAMIDHAELLQARAMRLSPHIIVDVGHNPMAACQMAALFKEKKVNLVYNSLADKDYQEILRILQPSIARLLILPLEGDRLLPEGELENFLDHIGIPYQKFSEIEDGVDYLVFGSFRVVAKFLEIYGLMKRREDGCA